MSAPLPPPRPVLVPRLVQLTDADAPDDTEPGLGVVALKVENLQLREQRDVARDALSHAAPGVALIALRVENGLLRAERDGARDGLYYAPPGGALIALRVENGQLRTERDGARDERDNLLVNVIVAPTPAARNLKLVFTGGSYAALVPVVVFLAGAAERKWPQFKDFIAGLLQAAGF